MTQIAVVTTSDLITYYSNLLIMQFANKPKAIAHIQNLAAAALFPQSVQTITFATAPTGGTFTVTFGGVASSSISFNASTSTIATALSGLQGFSSVVVTGSIASTVVTITGAMGLLQVNTNALTASGVTAGNLGITIAYSLQTLPLAILNGFNLTGSNIAVGAQLDILGKYVGVKRTATSVSGITYTLNDTDFLTLINYGIAYFNSDADLNSIQNLIGTYFSGKIQIYDYLTMRISYSVLQPFGSNSLVAAMISQGLLPRPTGVQMSVVNAPTTPAYFGFRSYANIGTNAGFNSYSSYSSTHQFLVYAKAILVRLN